MRKKSAIAIMSHGRRPLHPCGLAWLCAALLLAGLAGCASSQSGLRDSGHAYRAPTAGAHQTSAAPLSRALTAHYEQWRGAPYRLGGNTRSGIDCSAFVQQTMRSLRALDLPRTTGGQSRIGQQISEQELAVGDLVFFKTGRRSRHVGIYVGNREFMHASTSRGVTVSHLDNSYWRRHYWQSRRPTL